MRTSRQGIELIKSFETLELEAYRCPAGVLTIGYGHTRGVKEGDRITEYMADKYLQEDIERAEAVVLREVRVPLRQCEWDALVSLAFNIGNQAFAQSTLLKKINEKAGEEEIREEFGKWVYSDGQVLGGLVTRRKAEADMYFS